jgi:hypothetical protein
MAPRTGKLVSVAPLGQDKSKVDKGRPIVGAERQTLGKALAKRYKGGESLRSLVASTGRSYGFIHRVLTEQGVTFRQRGGARQRRKPGTA